MRNLQEKDKKFLVIPRLCRADRVDGVYTSGVKKQMQQYEKLFVVLNFIESDHKAINHTDFTTDFLADMFASNVEKDP